MVENAEGFGNKMMSKHCSCAGVENKILLETVSICPECQTLFSTLIYEVPSEKIRSVLERLSVLMVELKIPMQRGVELPFIPSAGDDTEGGTGE